MPSAEPWVGSWRPHRPRRPIAALYGSPGPKYALPGFTGIINHNPTKCKAPAFTFGKRCEKTKTESTPGPKYLVPAEITRNGHERTPAFSLHSRREEIRYFQTPGPGQYSTERSGKWVFHSAPSYSLSGRNREGSIDHAPGPASYHLPAVLGPKIMVTSSAPTYSISSRHKSGSLYQDIKQTPGPAAYKVVDSCVFSKKPPQYSITGRNFTPTESAKKPGPGAYNPEHVTFTTPKAPSYSFGLRHSQYITPLFENIAD